MGKDNPKGIEGMRCLSARDVSPLSPINLGEEGSGLDIQ
jgi:hypothetical protein